MTQPSGKLQTNLVNLVEQAMVNSAAHVQHHGKDARHAEKVEFLEFLEDEAVQSVHRLLGEHLDGMEISEPIRGMLDKMLDPEHPIELLAELIPILWAIGYQIGAAALAGPTQALTTVSLRNFGDVYPDALTGAAAAARNRMTPGEAQRWADNNGMRNVDLSILMDISKNTLPPSTALALWQQGKIDQDIFVEMMVKNGLDAQATIEFTKLRYQPPGVALAFNAVTQNQLDPARVQEIMDQNGLDPADYQWIYETNGQSPGVELLNKLKNYGLIDDALWSQGILESPLKNKYVDVLKNSRFHRPPMRTVLQMVHAGTIDKAKGLQYLEFNGFFPDDAEIMVDTALQQKTAGTKALTAANVRGMYVEGLIDRGTAESRTTALGYDAADTQLLLDYADSVRQRQRLNTALSHVRSQYLGHKIDEPTAIGAIDRLGVPGAMRAELIADWEIEHQVTITHLSDAVILKAGVSKLLTPDEVFQRLIAKGYMEADAHLLMEEKGIGTAEKAQLKDLTVAQILKLMSEGRLPEATAKQRIMAKGYSNDDAQKLIDSKLGRNADGTEPA